MTTFNADIQDDLNAFISETRGFMFNRTSYEESVGLAFPDLTKDQANHLAEYLYDNEPSAIEITAEGTLSAAPLAHEPVEAREESVAINQAPEAQIGSLPRYAEPDDEPNLEVFTTLAGGGGQEPPASTPRPTADIDPPPNNVSFGTSEVSDEKGMTVGQGSEPIAESSLPDVAETFVEGEYIGPEFEPEIDGQTFEADPHIDGEATTVFHEAGMVKLADHGNNDSVVDSLMEDGVRFTRVENDDAFSYLGGNHHQSYALYAEDGSVLEMTDKHAIKTIDGERFLVLRDKGMNFEKVEEPTIPFGPDIDPADPEAEKKRQEQMKNNGGGFSLNGLFRPRSPSDKPSMLSRAAMSDQLVKELKSAHTLFDQIAESGGPLDPSNRQAFRQFQESMERVQSNFEAISKAKLNMKDLGGFNEIKDLSDSLANKADSAKDFLVGGKRLFESEALLSMKKGIQNAISSVLGVFKGK